MGQTEIPYWKLEFWQYQGYSPVKQALEKLEKEKAVAHRHLIKKIRYLLGKPPSVLEKTGDLRLCKNGVWEFSVASGGAAHVFLGPFRYSSWGPSLVALEYYQNDDPRAHDSAIAVALARLSIYQEDDIFHLNHYGLQ